MGMAAIATGLQVVGGLGSAFGQYQAGQANKEYYNYLASENRKQTGEIMGTAKEQNRLTYDTASRFTEKTRKNLKSIIGSQKVATAGSGFTMGSKTAEDITRSSANIENEDEMAIRYNADISAWSTLKTANAQVKNLLSQAKGYDMAAKNASKSGGINAISSLLGMSKMFA